MNFVTNVKSIALKMYYTHFQNNEKIMKKLQIILDHI